MSDCFVGMHTGAAIYSTTAGAIIAKTMQEGSEVSAAKDSVRLLDIGIDLGLSPK